MGPWSFRLNEKSETEVYYHGIKIQGIISANIIAESDSVDLTSAESPWIRIEHCKPRVIVKLEILSDQSEEIPLLGKDISDEVYQSLKNRIDFIKDQLSLAIKQKEFAETKSYNLKDDVERLKSRNIKLKRALKSILDENVSNE